MNSMSSEKDVEYYKSRIESLEKENELLRKKLGNIDKPSHVAQKKQSSSKTDVPRFKQNVPRFELIVDCKPDHVNIIQDYIKKEVSGNFVIITDSDSLKDQFNKNGFHAETTLDIIPTNSNEEKRIYQAVWDHVKSLREIFSDIKYNEAEVFLGFRHIIHDELIMLEKFHSILLAKKKSHVIFCISYSSYHYLVCTGIASLLGYVVDWPLTVKDNNLVTTDSLPIAGQWHVYEALYHDKISTYKEIFGKPVKTRPYKIRRNLLQGLRRHGFINAIKIKKNEIKYDPEEHLKHLSDKPESKLFKKLAKYKFDKRPCILFTHTNDMDLYLKPVYPVIEEFQKEQYPYFVLAHDSRAQEALSRRKIDFLDYQPYLYDFGYDFETVKKMLNAIREIAVKNDSVISIYFQYLLNDVFCLEVINNLRLIRFFSALITKLNPISIFVMPDNIGDQLVMCQVAKKFGIKTLSTLANLIAPTARSVGFMGASIIATYGEDCNISLTGMGYGKDRLVMTGNPRYDSIKNLDPLAIRKILSKENEINFDRPIILIATSGHDKNEVDWMLDAITHAKKKNYEIIIKFHPLFEAERSKDLLDRAKGMRFHFLKYTDIEINEVICISTVVITDNSSTGMLAVLADKPVIVTNFMGEPYPDNRYDEYGVALLATSNKELESCIDKTIVEEEVQKQLLESRKKYQHWYNYKNDGMAASRIFGILTSESSKEVISV